MILDYILTLLSILSTIISVYSAYKSYKYFNKSRELAVYSKTNSAFIEINNIISYLTDMSEFSIPNKKRGVNDMNELSSLGKKILQSIDKIRENLPASYEKEFNKFINSEKIFIEKYICSIIDSSALKKEQELIFETNEDYMNCKNIFCEIQNCYKERLENLSEKINNT